MDGGYIMQLQNFSVNDGEGIRTTVFLSGCPLRCEWCANPEGQTLENPITSYMTVEEVMRHIGKQMIFYRHSGGGVTFSGGEPTMQGAFLRQLAESCYNKGISMAIETCGYFEFEAVSDVLEKMDLIFFDIKHMEEEAHKKFTGESNKRILQNLRYTARMGVPIVVRVPVICGVNGTSQSLIEIFEYVKKEAPEASLELLPYHTLGEGKYKELGLSMPSPMFSRPTDTELKQWERMAEDMGIRVISYR